MSHSDNTMTLSKVTSTTPHLTVSAGRTLWGHTFIVFNAQLSGRGKAVSVSARGDELRMRELKESSSDVCLMDCRMLVFHSTPEKKDLISADFVPLNAIMSRRGDGVDGMLWVKVSYTSYRFAMF